MLRHRVSPLLARTWTSNTAVSSLLQPNNIAAITATTRRTLSSGWNQRGYDLTFESLTFGNRPKCILQGYGPSGFDVFNIVKQIDPNEVSNGTLHMVSALALCSVGDVGVEMLTL